MSISASGLVSGLDINNIIEELMQLERQPIRRKEAQIERTEVIQDLWREINTVLDTYKRTLDPLLDERTYTASVPRSSNEEVLTATISGMPDEGVHNFNVTQLASYHAVAMDPPVAGLRISDPEMELGYSGSFYLGTGRQPEGLTGLDFSEATDEWLRGSFGAGFQAYVSGAAEDIFLLEPGALSFTEEMQEAGAESIKVYMDSFTGAGGEDLTEELTAYFSEKGWDVDLDDYLFEIVKDGEQWVALNQNGDPFALAGDHPLGTFGLRAEIEDDSGSVLSIEDFSFDVRQEGSVDESGLITIEEGDSLLTVAQRVNQVSEETGVKANIVRAGDGDYRLTLESTVEGKAGFIQAYDFEPLTAEGEVKYGTDKVLELLHLTGPASNAAGPVYILETQEALDAEFTYNGLEMSRSSNTFTDVVQGVEITLEGDGFSTLEIAPDIDGAMEDIALFVEAYNEANAFVRRVQDEDDGPLQGSGDVMRIERQLRTIIHGQVPDLPGSSHLRESLTYTGTSAVSATASGVYGLGSSHSNEALTHEGTGSAAAVASGTYEGSFDQIELVYSESLETWLYNNTAFTSGDSIEGVRIDIGAASNPGDGDTLTLDVTPPPEERPEAAEIELIYNAGASEWRHNGVRFESGAVIDGIRITIDEQEPPQDKDRLTLKVSPPTKEIKHQSLSAVGIMAEDEKGVLRVDEAKLREALTTDPESVYRLFAREAPVDSAGNKRGPDGIVRQIQQRVASMIGPGGLVQNRTASLQREMRQFADRIEMIERRLEMREERLVRQFTFMEQYIARIQEQTGLVASFEAMQQQTGS